LLLAGGAQIVWTCFCNAKQPERDKKLIAAALLYKNPEFYLDW